MTGLRAEVGPMGLSTRAAAEAYVGGVCFKLGPPELIGAELEWLTESSGRRVDLAAFAAALGPYAPKSISPDSPARPLPGGGYVTIEPGGQIEISSAPAPSVRLLCDRLQSDAVFLRRLLESSSIRMVSAAADARRPPARVLRLPRYSAMEESFSAVGPFGKLMMCNTAATQVCVDAGADAEEVRARWTALHDMGPALVAAFACSPRLRGAPDGSWASQRMRTWLHLDDARTAVPVNGSDPISGYARWAMDVPLLCVRRADGCGWQAPADATFADWLSGALDDAIGRRPDISDLEYHLTTVFPPVRAAGHLEVRYLDAQPEDAWSAPITALGALMSSPEVVAEATRLAASTAGRWHDAARYGLTDAELRSAASSLLELAASYSETPTGRSELDAAAHRCRRGRSPEEVAV